VRIGKEWNVEDGCVLRSRWRKRKGGGKRGRESRLEWGGRVGGEKRGGGRGRAE